METGEKMPIFPFASLSFLLVIRLLSCFWNTIKMMKSGNASTLPCGFHHLKDSAGILGTKGLFSQESVHHSSRGQEDGWCHKITEQGQLPTRVLHHSTRQSQPWFAMIGTWGWLSLSCEARLVFSLVMPVSLGASWTLPKGQNYLQIITAPSR